MCKLCGDPIHARQGIISCDGFCFDSYHPSCVGLKIEAVVIWNQHSSIWWMCDACEKMLRNMRQDESLLSRHAYNAPGTSSELKCAPKSQTRMDEEVAELKKQVNAIHQTLAEMSSSREISMNVAPIAESSPNHPPRVKHGSKPVGCRISNNSTALDASCGKYWLFLTKIKNTTTENDILEMVVDSLGIDNADAVTVKKLIPNWKDVSTMAYVSFKVGLDLKYKHAADRASTWPKGLCFREFVETAALWEPRR